MRFDHNSRGKNAIFKREGVRNSDFYSKTSIFYSKETELPLKTAESIINITVEKNAFRIISLSNEGIYKLGFD